MDILSSYTKQASRKLKTKKGIVWNVEKVASAEFASALSEAGII